MVRRRNKNTNQSLVANDRAGLKCLPKGLLDNARIEEDRRAHNRHSGDRRKADRAMVDARAMLSISLTDCVEGQLYNLSAQGCSLSLSRGSFQLGDAVWFRLEDVQPLKGAVRWVDGNKVGVEFDRPFYQAFFELVAQSNKPLAVSKAA